MCNNLGSARLPILHVRRAACQLAIYVVSRGLRETLVAHVKWCAMVLFKYFQRSISVLPFTDGPLSVVVPPSSIAAANGK